MRVRACANPPPLNEFRLQHCFYWTWPGNDIMYNEACSSALMLTHSNCLNFHQPSPLWILNISTVQEFVFVTVWSMQSCWPGIVDWIVNSKVIIQFRATRFVFDFVVHDRVPVQHLSVAVRLRIQASVSTWQHCKTDIDNCHAKKQFVANKSY